MNKYEEMLLNEAENLKRKISNLVEILLQTDGEADEELKQISKVIEFSVEITDKCSFEVDEPYIEGEKTFCSVDDYCNKEDYFFADDAVSDGVDFDGSDCSAGSLSWNDMPSVSVEWVGLSEDASEEAQTLWDAFCAQKRRQEQLAFTQQRLEAAQKQLAQLQAEVAAAEATT